MPSKFSLVIIGLFFVCTAFLWFSQFRWDTSKISVGGHKLEVLLAKTPRQWQKGVGGRESLEPYEGMLFLFPDSRRHGIVMRDTLIPLDIIWLERGVVVDIAPNIPLELDKKEKDLTRYYPRTNANMVLEVPAGFVEQKGLKIGDTLSILDGE